MGALGPLYDAGEYARGGRAWTRVLETYPDKPRFLYNVACCESLAGLPADAIEHLRRAIADYEPLGALAADDSDFDPIRDEPAFKELVQSE